MAEKLVIFSAPSGAGKTTIVKHLLSKSFNLEFSISACNRTPRKGEVDGVDYYFLTTEDFKKKIENDDFIEWEEVYEGRYYGTLKSEIVRIWNKNNNVLFDVDVEGGINIKKQYGDKALSIFVKPPSIEELRNRLIKRDTDSIEEINKRVDKAKKELEYADEFDFVILNDDLEEAKVKTENILNEFLNKE
jgi:guanylate kinase